MEIFSKVVYVVMLLSAIGIVVLVLLQHGKGADMGTGFGAGASGSLFGASGSANFLSRTTAILAGVFFAATLGLAYFATNRPHTGGSVMQNLSTPAQTVPGAPATALPADATKTAPAAPVGDTSKQVEIPK